MDAQGGQVVSQARRGTRVGPLQLGDQALVMGAAGALGACCVQVAKLAGAHVIAAAGADDRVAAALSYGAEAGGELSLRGPGG